jgi:hypothetical protein
MSSQYQKSKRRRINRNTSKKISHSMRKIHSIHNWWNSYREPCYDADVMISNDRRVYFFFEEENRGDEYWSMGLIGERPGACEGTCAYSVTQLLELFPDVQDELPSILEYILDDDVNKIDFRKLGITLAKKANFYFLSELCE